MFLKVVVFLALFGATLSGSDWVKALKGADKRVPRIEIQLQGEPKPRTCSGAVINAKEGFILTAAHCIEAPKNTNISITAADKHAELMKSNDILDLAVIQAKFDGIAEFQLAPNDPEAGTEVAIMGYAFGINEPAFQVGHIAQTRNKEWKKMLVNIDGIFGDSGGPIINQSGQLIGMTSGIWFNGPAHLTGAVGVEAVRDFVNNFLPKTP